MGLPFLHTIIVDQSREWWWYEDRASVVVSAHRFNLSSCVFSVYLLHPQLLRPHPNSVWDIDDVPRVLLKVHTQVFRELDCWAREEPVTSFAKSLHLLRNGDMAVCK